MQLSRWLEQQEMTASEFGRRMDVSHVAVLRWCRGERIPRPQMMRKIREVTNDAVKPADFFSEAAA